MAYFSGVMFGNDEIGSNNYFDDLSLFDNDPPPRKNNIRSFSGYDYHSQGHKYKPPLPKQPPPRKNYQDPPRKLRDLWRLKKDTKQREGFQIEDSQFWVIVAFIIFLMIIYCISMYRMVQNISQEILELLKVLADLKKPA